MELLTYNARTFPRRSPDVWRDEDGRSWLPMPVASVLAHGRHASLERGRVVFHVLSKPYDFPSEGKTFILSHPVGPTHDAAARMRVVEAKARALTNARAWPNDEARHVVYRALLHDLKTTLGVDAAAPPIRVRVVAAYTCTPDLAREMGPMERSAACVDPPATTLGSECVASCVADLEPASWRALTELFPLSDLFLLAAVQQTAAQLLRRAEVAGARAARAVRETAKRARTDANEDADADADAQADAKAHVQQLSVQARKDTRLAALWELVAGKKV